MGYLNSSRGEAREGRQAATVAALTNANGTANGTVSALGSTWDVTAQGIANDNFRECSDKINAVIAALKSAGLMA